MTDIQGYTDASSTSSREEIIGLIRRHNQLMVPVISFYGGRIIKSIGDAFLCTFTSATDAVVCAIIIQLLLKDYNDRQAVASKKMKLRVVINSGDVTLEKNDIYGDAVNITARIEGLPCFPGGSIGISESTYLLMNRNEIVAEKIGPQTLKGIPDPVTVYRIPLDKQKLTEIPLKLAQVVEKAVSEKSSSPDGLMSSNQIGEWSDALAGFLREKKWGENISAFIDEAKIKETAGVIQGQLKQTFTKENLSKALTKEGVATAQKKIAETFSQKTVVESKKADEMNDAPMVARVKCFVIDAIILGLAWVIISCGLWWPVQSMLWGREYIPAEELVEKSIKGISDPKERVQIDRIKDSYNYNRYAGRYYRPKSIFEWAISINIEYPFIPFVIYFGFFWMAKGASPGQIAGKNAVVMADGTPMDPQTAFKRAAIFVFSNIIVFAGSLMMLGPEKITLYDKICGTKVVE